MADKNANNEQDRSVEEIMHETDLGEVILKYKTHVIAGVIVVLLVIAGGTFFNSYSKKQAENQLNVIFDFTTNYLDKFKAGDIDKEKLLTAAEDMFDEAGKNPSVLIPLIDSAMALKDKGMVAEAIKIARHGMTAAASNKYSNYIMSSNLAVLLEDSGDMNGAIEILEKLAQSKNKFYEAKIYLDLGRLYGTINDTQKAKLNLKYVLDNYPNDDLAKMAKLYLNKLN